MANDSSLRGEQFPFDLESQSGVMQLLAAVRASELGPQEKNELRDLVFAYANGGHDPSVKITIEQKVAANNIEPLPAPKSAIKEPEKPLPAFGTSRPAPKFSAASAPVAPVAQSASASASVAQPAPEPVSAPVPPQPAPVVPPKVETPAPEPTPVVPAPTPVPEPVVASAPVPPPMSQPAPVPAPAPEPEFVPEPAPTPTPTPAPVAPAPEPVNMVAPPAPEPEPSADASEILQRIREIKATVNERVGNPVNLVDIDNEVGREYMAALLDAMKKVNSGTSAKGAMERLEAAFSAVETAIEKHEASAQTAPMQVPEPQPAPVAAPAPEPEFVPEPAPAPAPAPVAPEPEPIEEAAEPVVVAVAAEIPTAQEMPMVSDDVPANIPTGLPANEEPEEEPVPTPTPIPMPQPLPSEPEQNEVPRPGASPQTRAAEEQAAREKPVAIPVGTPAPIPAKSDGETIESAWGPSTDTLRPSAVTPPQGNEGKVASLAQTGAKLRTPDELPLASSLETSSVAGDPLFTKEVDNGLDQLLSEWTLFKKSGLFGTGPKGREHPLFKKIKDLQIPLLLAGRFEGATQEIKQSITDYMNGWRYEQGIIYEQGETFEHYLRRVIRHILDLQKNK